VITAALALVAAGCGSSEQRLTQNAYVKQVNAETATIRYAIKRADELRGNAPVRDRRRKLKAAARDVRSAGERLADLSSPLRWEEEHATLVKSVQDLATSLEQLAKVSATDSKARVAAYRKVQLSADSAGKAIASINESRGA
jgi:hypothetical protein